VKIHKQNLAEGIKLLCSVVCTINLIIYNNSIKASVTIWLHNLLWTTN